MNDILNARNREKKAGIPAFTPQRSVMRGHPDKLCDLIADSVLDACLQRDQPAAWPVEVMAAHGHIDMAGRKSRPRPSPTCSTSSATLCGMSAMTRKTTRNRLLHHDQSPGNWALSSQE